MKKTALLLGLAAAMMSGPGFAEATPEVAINTGGTDDSKARYIANLKKKGVKEFNIDGKIILARTYENALKKFKRSSPL